MASLNLVTCMALATMVAGSLLPSRREPVDAFKVIDEFPRAVSIYTSINDTVMKCTTANRTYLDPEQKKASYVWELKGDGSSSKRNITVYWQEGEAPDLPTYYIDYDPTHSHIAHTFYTDYSTCVVMKMSFLGHDQCMLWVKPDVVDDIPRHCRHNYKRHCQVRYPTYDKELCKEN